MLGALEIGIVGCGGLGSNLAESFVRLGVRSLQLVDEDRLDDTNLNRWQGATPAMVGKPKAKLLRRRLRLMFPGVRVESVPRSVYHADAIAALKHADIIVGAVDNDEGRYFLNRLALQYGIPYFDAGVAIVAEEGKVDFLTRFFAVLPGVSACVECTQYHLVDRARVVAAFLDEATSIARKRAGYVIDAPDMPAPSAYALNQRAGGLLVTELLNFVCGFRPAATMISESWRRGKFERADRANFPEGPDPECPICGYYAGAADSEPLPRPTKMSHGGLAEAARAEREASIAGERSNG